MTDAFGLLALIQTLQAKGDYAGAIEYVDKFEARLQGTSRPVEFSEPYRTLRVRVQFDSGDLDSAFTWADQVQLTDDYKQHAEYYQLTLARLRLAQGRFAEVEKILTAIPADPGFGNFVTRQIEIKMLLASALAGQDRLLEGIDLVEKCLAMAEPEGFIRIFLNIGSPAYELLDAYLKSPSPVHKNFAEKLVSLFSTMKGIKTDSESVSGLIDPLSERELEVLNLISSGKTNQEIARLLFVAPGTIKAHAASIYRKLDVANRTEAVSQARSLKLIP